MHWSNLAWLIIGCCIALGCGAGQPTLVPDPVVQAPTGSRANTAPIDPANLPKLADPLPPLDKGRVVVAGPEGWTAAGRDAKWLARYVSPAGSQYPTIQITAEDSPEPAELTKENAGQFAAQTRDALARALAPKPAPEVTPLVLGDYVGVSFEDSPRTKSTQLDRLVLITIAGGRKYTVELLALSGTLEKYREQALAVAHGLKFQRAADSPAVPEASAAGMP